MGKKASVKERIGEAEEKYNLAYERCRHWENGFLDCASHKKDILNAQRLLTFWFNKLNKLYGDNGMPKLESHGLLDLKHGALPGAKPRGLDFHALADDIRKALAGMDDEHIAEAFNAVMPVPAPRIASSGVTGVWVKICATPPGKKPEPTSGVEQGRMGFDEVVNVVLGFVYVVGTETQAEAYNKICPGKVACESGSLRRLGEHQAGIASGACLPERSDIDGMKDRYVALVVEDALDGVHGIGSPEMKERDALFKDFCGKLGQAAVDECRRSADQILSRATHYASGTPRLLGQDCPGR